MRRPDRLFLILQYLRSRRLTTARWLADRLGVSVRTIYRDVQHLSLCGVQVEGEAGVGYFLRRKPDLPPLQFDRDELAAINLGLRFVIARTAQASSRAGSAALAKIRAVLPQDLLAALDNERMFVPVTTAASSSVLKPLDDAIKQRQKVQMTYTREDGVASERVVRPLAFFYWGPSWTLLAWCETRTQFRTFRPDRMSKVQLLDERFTEEAGKRLGDYFRQMEMVHKVPLKEMDPEAAG